MLKWFILVEIVCTQCNLQYSVSGIVNVNVEETEDGRIALRAYPTQSSEDVGKSLPADDTKVR